MKMYLALGWKVQKHTLCHIRWKSLHYYFLHQMINRIYPCMLDPIALFVIITITSIWLSSHALQCEMRCSVTDGENHRLCQSFDLNKFVSMRVPYFTMIRTTYILHIFSHDDTIVLQSQCAKQNKKWARSNLKAI